MKRINLLPQEERVKASRERGLICAILILVAVVVVLGLVYVKHSSDVSDKQDELARLQAETAVVQAQIAELSPYARSAGAAHGHDGDGEGHLRVRVSWSDHPQELSLVIPENVRLQTLTATVPPTMLPGAAAAAARRRCGRGRRHVHRADRRSTDDVAEFMTRLGLIPQLTDIQLTHRRTRVTATAPRRHEHGDARPRATLHAVHGDGVAAALHARRLPPPH